MTLFVWPPLSVNTSGLATDAKLDTIITYIDGVETLIGATNTKLDTINGNVDNVESLVTSTNTKLDTIGGYVDGIEGALTTLNAKDFATQTTLAAMSSAQATAANQTSTNAKLDTLNAKDFATQATLALLNTKSAGAFVPVAYDYMTYTSGSTTDTYVFKSGGAGGTTVKTLTLTYTDSTKAVLSTVAAT